MPNKEDMEICCSFCGKTQDEVTRLVEGPGVYICDRCIQFCSSLLFEDELPQKSRNKKEPKKNLYYPNRKRLRISLTNT